MKLNENQNAADIFHWYQPRTVGLGVALLLAVAIVGMVLTHDRRLPHDISQTEAAQITAVATKRLAAFQLLTVIVGIPTLILLGWSLVETRRSNTFNRASLDLAEQVSVIEFKPYLSVSNSRLDKIVYIHEEFKASFGFTVLNTGKSAAYKLANLRFLQYQIISPDNSQASIAPIKRFDVVTSEAVSAINPGGAIDLGGMVTFDGRPPFDIDVAPCYQIILQFELVDISTIARPGMKRVCRFQVQRGPFSASETLKAASDVTTVTSSYLYSDSLVPE